MAARAAVGLALAPGTTARPARGVATATLVLSRLPAAHPDHSPLSPDHSGGDPRWSGLFLVSLSGAFVLYVAGIALRRRGVPLVRGRGVPCSSKSRRSSAPCCCRPTSTRTGPTAGSGPSTARTRTTSRPRASPPTPRSPGWEPRGGTRPACTGRDSRCLRGARARRGLVAGGRGVPLPWPRRARAGRHHVAGGQDRGRRCSRPRSSAGTL